MMEISYQASLENTLLCEYGNKPYKITETSHQASLETLCSVNMVISLIKLWQFLAKLLSKHSALFKWLSSHNLPEGTDNIAISLD
jgi:hypothetical protein